MCENEQVKLVKLSIFVTRQLFFILKKQKHSPFYAVYPKIENENCTSNAEIINGIKERERERDGEIQ